MGRRTVRGGRKRDGAAPAGVAASVIVALAVLLPAGPALASLTLVSYPTELVQLDEEITVSWVEPVDCRLLYGRSPGDYPSGTASHGVGSLTFTPGSEGMTTGIHYCVVQSLQGDERSPEFLLIAESPVFPVPVAPANGGVVQGTTTLLRWDPVEGVPFYHVLVSDSEVQLEEQNGQTVLTGANVVWQAITGETSIQYGSVDPSGHFVESNGESPPLMSGFDYRWLVLNNFGNHPLLTSLAGAGLAGFTADVPVTMDPPALLAPQDSLTVVDDVLEFRWQPVDGAVGYRLYVYQRRTWAGGEASYPVWNGSTTVPTVQIHLASFLVTGEYHWRVIALDEGGAGVASELRRFDYSSVTGTAHITTTTEDGQALGAVLVEIGHASGGGTVIPAVTDASGYAQRTLAPGEYEFLATKAEFVDTTALVVVPADGSVEVPISMRRARARLRGSVVDALDQPVAGATVTASGEGGSTECPTDNAGAFALQLEPGLWQVRAEKQGYVACQPETVRLVAGEYAELATPLILTGSPGSLAGSVVNAGGTPVAGATVWARSGGTSSPATTDGSGHFALTLAPGTWAVWAEKAGFRPSDARTAEIPPGGSVPLDPPICLYPADSCITGRVSDGHNPVAGARVVASPRSGAVSEAITNGYGEFVLLPPRSEYTLTALAPGYRAPDSYRISTGNGDSFVGIELRVIPPVSAVEGVVTLGGTPVAGATVTDGVTAAVTQSDGTFSLALLSGLHAIRAESAGCVPGERLLVATGAGQEMHGLALAVSPGAGSVRGRVMSQGLTVPGASVEAVSGDAIERSSTGADGAYELLVEPGTWTVTAAGMGFQVSDPSVVTVASGQTATGVDLEIESTAATLRGTVSDAMGGVACAQLALLSAGGDSLVCRSVTSVTGMFMFHVEPARAYVLESWAPLHGYVRATVAPIVQGATRTVDFVLPRWSGSLQGAVEDDEGTPVPDALVVAAWGDSALARTERDGRYALWLDDGVYDLRVQCPGHLTARYHDVEVVGGVVTSLDPVLTTAFAALEGTVTDSLTDAPVGGVLVTALSGRSGSSAITDSEGRYRTERVLPGNAQVHFWKPGFRTRALQFEAVPNGTQVMDVRMLELSGTISGRVTGAGGEGIEGASVAARLGSVAAAATTTDGLGRYLLVGLDPDATFEVGAWKDGFYAASENPFEDVPTASEGIDFTLLPAQARLAGLVVDGTSLEGLAGAEVTADNGLGHFGRTTTDAEGRFAIGSLAPVGLYVVSAELYGYHEALRDSVPPGTEDIRFELPRNFATIAGTLTSADPTLPLAELVVVATNTAFGGEGRATAPDVAGAYEICDLRPGPYVVSVGGQGCLATPAQAQVELGEGHTASGLDFSVERASVARVEVGGPSEIEAGCQALFSGSAMTADGRLLESELVWSVSPSPAGSIDAATGLLAADPGYIGEVTVRATEPVSGSAGELGALIFGRVSPAGEARYRDAQGMSLTIPAGAVPEARSVYLAHEEISDARRFSREFEIRGLDYHLKPDGLAFVGGREPRLALPTSGGAEIATWDRTILKWDAIGGDPVEGGLEVRIPTLGEFAVLTESEALAVRGLRASPNPFSPDRGAVTISYELSSNEARMPFVTVTLYNMVGQRVRRLVENEPQGKGGRAVEWDGTTDGGEWARNGRYVVEVAAEDPSGEASARATLVLVK